MKKQEWLKARCPICDKEYEYLPEYKPATCGNFDCIYEWLHAEALRHHTEAQRHYAEAQRRTEIYKRGGYTECK